MDIHRTIHEVASLRCTDDGVAFIHRERLAYIASVTALAGYRETALPLARIYRAGRFDAKRPFVIVSSHVDELPTEPWSDEIMTQPAGRWLKGTYDNAITNAVLLYLMAEGRLGDQTVIAFTGNEECENGHEMEGAKQVIGALHPRPGTDFCLVLDVTAEGRLEEDDFTIENVFPEERATRSGLLSELRGRVAGAGAYRCIPDGWEDEAQPYDRFGLACCSLCVPTRGPMHENEGLLVRKGAIPGYVAALTALSRPYPPL